MQKILLFLRQCVITMCLFYNNLLTKIIAWSAISYHICINIEYPFFSIVGPGHLAPKTSLKTSHFLLNDAMFQQCFEKNIDLDVFDDVWKNQNIAQTMHLTMLIAHPYLHIHRPTLSRLWVLFPAPPSFGQKPNQNWKNWIFKMQPKIVVMQVLETPEHIELGLLLQNWIFTLHFNFWVHAKKNGSKRSKKRKLSNWVF